MTIKVELPELETYENSKISNDELTASNIELSRKTLKEIKKNPELHNFVLRLKEATDKNEILTAETAEATQFIIKPSKNRVLLQQNDEGTTITGSSISVITIKYTEPDERQRESEQLDYFVGERQLQIIGQGKEITVNLIRHDKKHKGELYESLVYSVPDGKRISARSYPDTLPNRFRNPLIFFDLIRNISSDTDRHTAHDAQVKLFELIERCLGDKLSTHLLTYVWWG